MIRVVSAMPITVKITPNLECVLNPEKFFISPSNTVQKQYEALRSFYVEKCTAKEVAERFGYTVSSFYSLTRDFKKWLSEGSPVNPFFISRKAGRKPQDNTGKINQCIIDLRKKYLSVSDIKANLDAQGYKVSEKYVYNTIVKEGFERLPRRNFSSRERATSFAKIEAPKSVMLDYSSESFSGQNSLGVLCVLPLLQMYGIDKLIEKSKYPETENINILSSILSFVALKLSNVKRYTADDIWCMDRGLGLFAGLNVLPKAAWFTSYSNGVIRSMNRSFLKSLNDTWRQYGLLSDTANMDFTTIPYWGENSHLENNWSGKRHKGLASMLSVIAQDPDTGILTYGDTTVRHTNQNEVVNEFLDFYNTDDTVDLKYLVFDSKFTTYENLGKLPDNIKFLTIRRRGKNIVDKLNKRKPSEWKKIRVSTADGKGRSLKIIDDKIFLKEYGGYLRQIAITGHGKIKPALIITNDYDLACEDAVRKYARRWLVEKSISEQIEFFHLNKNSSSIVIKVDFDLTMTILAHNLLRLLAINLPGYSHMADATLYTKFLSLSGGVEISSSQIKVKIKKKKNLPALLTAMQPFQGKPIKMLRGRKLVFLSDTTT